MTTRMKAPAGISASSLVLLPDGTTAAVDVNGLVACPTAYVHSLLAAGFTFYQAGVAAPSGVAITTVGAGTLTAAALVAGIILRSGSTAAYTDTTDTAAAIVAAGTYSAGDSFECIIRNNAPFAQTLAGGTGVTMAGNLVVPALSSAVVLVQIVSATAVTATVEAIMSNDLLGATHKRVAVTSGTAAMAAGDMEGVKNCFLNYSGQATPTFTTRTAAQIIAGIPDATVGDTWMLRVLNYNSGTTTLAAGSNVTINGTATLPTATWTDFLCSFATATTVTMTNVGSGDAL